MIIKIINKGIIIPFLVLNLGKRGRFFTQNIAATAFKPSNMEKRRLTNINIENRNP